jgi:hypothetical protein
LHYAEESRIGLFADKSRYAGAWPLHATLFGLAECIIAVADQFQPGTTLAAVRLDGILVSQMWLWGCR